MLNRHFNDVVLFNLPSEVVAGLLKDLDVTVRGFRQPKQPGVRTSLTAHLCGSSSWLIFPFGKPQPADDFQPLTRIHCRAMVRTGGVEPSHSLHTFSHASFNMIAPHTGTLVLYCMKLLKAISKSELHRCRTGQARKKIWENLFSGSEGNWGFASRTKSS